MKTSEFACEACLELWDVFQQTKDVSNDQQSLVLQRFYAKAKARERVHLCTLHRAMVGRLQRELMAAARQM